MTSQATELRCSACGAPVPFIGHGEQRCLFCLKTTAVPAGIAVPLKTSKKLEAQVKSRLQYAARARSGMRSQSLWVLGILAFGAFILFASYGSMFRQILEDVQINAIPALLSAGTVSILAFGFFVLPIGTWAITHRLSTQRQLASVPFATITITDQIEPHCPSCGDNLKTSGTLTSTCAQCGTVSLLPAPLVTARLQGQHARAVAAHKSGVVVRETAEMGFRRAQYASGAVFFAIGALCLVGIPIAVMLLQPIAMQHLSTLEALGAGLMTGMFVGSIGFFAGAASIRAARSFQPHAPQQRKP